MCPKLLTACVSSVVCHVLRWSVLEDFWSLFCACVVVFVFVLTPCWSACLLCTPVFRQLVVRTSAWVLRAPIGASVFFRVRRGGCVGGHVGAVSACAGVWAEGQHQRSACGCRRAGIVGMGFRDLARLHLPTVLDGLFEQVGMPERRHRSGRYSSRVPLAHPRTGGGAGRTRTVGCTRRPQSPTPHHTTHPQLPQHQGTTATAHHASPCVLCSQHASRVPPVRVVRGLRFFLHPSHVPAWPLQPRACAVLCCAVPCRAVQHPEMAPSFSFFLTRSVARAWLRV
jgi:hypothetical protein